MKTFRLPERRTDCNINNFLLFQEPGIKVLSNWNKEPMMTYDVFGHPLSREKRILCQDHVHSSARLLDSENYQYQWAHFNQGISSYHEIIS